MFRKAIMATTLAASVVSLAPLASQSFAATVAGPGCFKTDAIVNGKRRAPTPALIAARERSPVCLMQPVSAVEMVYRSPQVLRELQALNDELSWRSENPLLAVPPLPPMK